MAITTYASRGYKNGYQSGGVLSNPVGITTYASRGRSEEEDKNRGGLIGGIGYLGEKLAVGAVSSIEGISDYTFSGLAKLFGNDAWAEDIIKNDWFGDWYSHPEEWFNPGQGWQVAGDVAGGIGTSLPGMAAAIGATVATGGLAAPAAAAIVGGASFLTSGLGAAGRATKEAYEQTGKLTGKEYGYGALVGATEGGVEALGNLLSLGSGAVVKSVSKAIGKETAEAFAKQGILKTLGSSFAGEAFEEGFSEFITPYWQRATYDPKAKNASADEILYASLVGGLSGVVMGGGGYVIDNVTSFSKGNKLAISGGDAQVLETSGYFSAFEDANQSGDELFSDIANKRKSLLESLSKTNGKAVTIQQKRDLGALERANIAGSMKLFVATRAQNIVNNAPLIAERLTAFGYKTADGKPIRFTAEEITAGYDPKKPSSIYKALQTNSKLRELAVADATGRLMMDTNQFKKNALMGEKLASQVDINRFYEQASREELQAVTDALKIESWSELTPEIFNQKITDFINDGGVQRTLDAKERKAAFAALTQEGAQNVPKIVNLGKDGMRRYTDGQLDIAVERKGDKYTLYNYKTDNLSKEMKREDINKFFRDYSNQKEEYLAAERERLEVEQKRRAEFEGIETMLRDNVKEYKTLNAPSQSIIRRLVREGRAKGVSDSDLLMYAKVSAHSGIDIQFDKEANYRGVKKDGSADYADGFYEAAKNRIVVNPDGKRTAERLLIHELDHAIRKYFDSEGKQATRIYLEAIEGVDQATRDKITEAYKKTAKPGEAAATIMDETNAYYAEQVLGNKYTLEKLIEAEPTLKDKILSFFKGASTDYADVPKLSGAAKKYYRTYKKLFDEFSARNAQSNANEKTLTSMNQKNMQISGRHYALEETEDGRLIAVVEDDILSGIYTGNWNKTTADKAKKAAKTALLKFKDGIAVKGITAKVNKTSRDEYARSDYSEALRKHDPETYADKLRAASVADDVVIAASNWNRDGGLNHLRKDDFVDFDRGETLIMSGNNQYKADVIIGITSKGEYVFYDVENMYPTQFDVKKREILPAVTPDEPFDAILKDSSNSSIPQTEGKSNSFDKNSSNRQDALDLGDSHKQAQFDIIQKTNPMFDEYHVGIRSADDIRTWEEVLKLDDESEGQFVWGDFSRADAEQALKNGKVTVYSSYPIKNGVFVSTSYIQAEQYSGGRGGKVYLKTVPLDKIAWINGDEGQYADATTASGKQYALDIDSEGENISGAEVMKPKGKTKAKAKSNAKAQPKTKTKAQVRAEQVVENQKIRTKADYTTDKVFSQASVNRGFDSVEAVKKLPGDVREKIARDLWLELEASDSDDVRDTFALKYSVKLYQAIREADSEAYENMSPKQRDELQAQLRDTVREIAKSGKESKLSRMKGDVRGIVRLEERVGAEYKSKIYQNLGKIKDKKYRRFTEASAYKGDVFKGSIDELTKIDWRGKFSANIARKEIKRLSEWYTEENPMLKGFETGNENSKTQHTTNFSMNIRYMLDMLSEGEGDFKNSELRMLSDVTEYFAKLVDEYDKIYVEGKWQDGDPLARELVDIVKKQDKLGVPIVVRALRNKLLSAGFRTFGDALSVMKLADMYGNGLFTRYYNEWLQGEINADAEAMKIKERYDAFMKENRKFLKNAETETVKLHGIDVRKIDLISYAMTLKRKQAWESIAEGGVVFRDPKDGRGSHIYPTAEVVKGEGYSKRLEATMQAELDNVMSMLTEKDVQYMKVLEEGFELARTTKAMGDMQRYGFVSVIDGYYYPIKHEYTSHLSAFDVELIATDRYANASFNKSQTEGAKSAIRISSADATFNSHVKGVSRYLYLSPVMDSFNKLYKLQLNTEGNGDIITSDVRGNSYSLQSVIDQSKSAWRQDGKLVGFDYLQNLMLDTMGMGKSVGDDFAAKLRGAAVTFSLGANPKVLVTQLSSLISSTSILSYGSHFKALGIWNGNVDNYSVVAKLRNSDYTVAKAEGVIDRINTWSRVFTAGISLMDRFVVNRTFAACQVEVAKNKGPAVGTEENRVAAGKLLDKVILETQQNSLTSRRTEGARRGNILTKQVQMYKSDAITSFGRAVDGWGEMNYLGALLRSNTLTDAERGTIQNRFEESKKKLAKSVGSIVGQAAFMMLVTEIFRNFYGKNDDETEEEKRTRLVVDAIGNLVNGVPVVSEVVSAITSNFGFETMEFSALNDFFDTAKGVIDYTEKRLEGKATERDGNKLMQNLLYTAGQLTGVPTRNMKNVSYGVVRLFSKDAAYKWDNAIYKKNYSADLNEAVAKGDMNRATMIMELALGEKLGSGFSTEAIGELTRLAGLGEKIIPGAISDTITVNGEEFVLSAEQYEAVKAEYDKVISAVNSFIESKFYNSLADDQRAKALRKLYSTYKDVSYDRSLGTQKNPKANLISSLLGENVFNAYLTLGVIESDVDSNGNTISGSKRAKVVKAIGALGVSVEERLLLICASGYALKDGDVRGLSADGAKRRLLKYILNLRGLSADERAEIAVMCGFEVRNGKIINNFSKKLKKISKK